MNYKEILQLFASQARIAGTDYEQDIVPLIVKTLGIERSELHAYPEREVSEDEYKKLTMKLNRLLSDEPLEYIIEEAEFMGYRLKITPDVLIPRVETESLVQLLVADLNNQSKDKPVNVLEVGVGSGCIAVALKKLAPLIEYTGLEISLPAMEIARSNLSTQLGINFVTNNGKAVATEGENQTTLINSDIKDYQAAPAARPTHIIANAPYITSAEMAALPPSVKNYEPQIALDGGPDGLEVYKSILSYVNHLEVPASLFFEASPSTVSKLKSAVEQLNLYREVVILPDQFGRERFLIARQ